MSCIFCRIGKGEVPATKVHEDELVVVIRDIRPQAPTHLLVIPKEHIASLWDLENEALAGRLLQTSARVARAEGLERGWRLIANTREHGGQEVDHVHLHVLGGRALGPMLPGSHAH
ncbi:MAG: hypothetical protein RL277_979 [Planctomycetota bacterium]|jgi:histidine triad (HIT) family protein